MQTFFVNTDAGGTIEDCLFAISNTSTNRNDSIEIRDLEISPVPIAPPSASLRAFGKLQVSRINSATLVEFDTADRITPVKHSSATSDLPSQVVITKNGYVSGTSIPFRTILPNPQINALGASQALGVRGAGDLFIGCGRPHTSAIYCGIHGGSTVEPIKIKAGEALVLTDIDNSNIIYPCSWYISVVFKVTGGGSFTVIEEYSPARNVAGTIDDDGFIIYNGSGSGVDLDIMSIDFYDIGQFTIATNTDVPLIRIIKGDQVSGGQTINPVSVSSLYSAPSLLSIKRHRVSSPLVLNPSSRAGMNIYQDFGFPNTTANYPFIRKINTLRNLIPSITNFQFPNTLSFISSKLGKGVKSGLSAKGTQTDGIILYPNETLGIVMSNNNIYARYNISAKILYNPATGVNGETFFGHS